MPTYGNPAVLNPNWWGGGASAADENARQWGTMPLSPDLALLQENYKRSKAAHDALMRASLMESQADNALLQNAPESDIRMLFSKPTTQQQQRLQQIVQKDSDAKRRGEFLIPNWLQKYNYDIAQERLGDVRDQRNIRNANLDLAYNRADREQYSAMANVANQQALRQQAAQKFHADQLFRQAQTQNAEKNYQLRLDDLNRRRQQGDLSAMVQMERLLQDKADAEAAQQRGTFHDAARAAEYGAVPLNEVQRLFGGVLNPTTQAMVEGYARRAGQGIDSENQFLQGQADLYNEQLQQALNENRRSGLNYINPFYSPTPTPEIIAPFASQVGKDKQLRGRLRYDATTQSFVPTLMDESGYGVPEEDDGSSYIGQEFAPPAEAPPVQQQRQPRFQEGQVVRNRRDGSVWKVQNGQLVPIRR